MDEKKKETDIKTADEAPKDADKPATTCYGCLNNRPGQRDHMEVGGCLYDGFSEDDD